MSDLTPPLRLAHVDGALDYCRESGTVPFASFESARNHLAAVVAEHGAALAELEQLRAQLVQAREEGAARAALGTSPAVWCWSRHPDHPLPCGRFAGHEGQHIRGEHRWDDAQQPEDGDRG